MANTVFTKKSVGSIGGDCTSRYALSLKKKATVREFIDAIISDKQEWGHISVSDGPGIWFKNGEYQMSSNMEKMLNKKVKKASASGGWSRMDYVLQV